MTEAKTTNNNLFILPAWWVQLYDPAAFPLSSQGTALVDLPKNGVSVTPRFNEYEQNVLAAVLSLIQRSLLAGGGGKILIRSEEISGLFSAGGLRDRNRDIVRTVESILSMRFMVGDSSGSRTSIALLCENMKTQIDPHGGEAIEWEMDPVAQQLAIGLYEPYSDLLRECEKGFSLRENCGKNGPLSVWSAPWLDLSGPEQRFLLRLERAMQWDFRWMHLDGIFGERFDLLVAGLRPTLANQSKGGATALSTAAMVQKILQRLVEHGLLMALTEIDYLAMQPDSNLGAQLIWQVSSSRMQEFEENSFRENSAKSILWPMYRSQFKRILAALAMNSNTSTLPYIEIEASRIMDSAGQIGLPVAQPLSTKGGVVIQQLPLFIEWLIRSRPNHPMPLPYCVGELGVNESLETAMRSFSQGFDDFQMRVRQMPEAFERVMNQSGASVLFCYKEKDHSNVLDLLRQGLKSNSNAGYMGSELRINRSVDRGAVPTVTQTAPAPEVKKQSIHGIRQIATEELQKLRLHDPQEYERLKNRYLETLDPSRRKILSDVQRRMTPDTFEQHLRHSLIKFMIDNPASWRTTTRTAQQSLPSRSSTSSSAIWGN